MITITDKLIRELDIIKSVFEGQRSPLSINHPFCNTEIQDTNGNLIAGRYIYYLEINSNVELFNIQDFKQQITLRWESALNHVLIKNQLNEIHKKASAILNYYNESLTLKNEDVMMFINEYELLGNEKKIQEREELLEHHTGIVTVHDFYIDQFYMGRTSYSVNLGFCYRLLNNYLLANICQSIVHFINSIINTKIENHSLVIESIFESNQRSLKNIFKEPDAYENLIDFMVSENFILKGKAGLFWNGKKLEIAAFFNTLYTEGFINVDISNDKIGAEIAKNTFSKFSITDRTLRNNNYGKYIEKYKAMLSKFNPKFPKFP